MTTEKRYVVDIFELDIEEINKDRICVDYVLDNEDNYIDLMESIGVYLIPLDDEYYYSDDSKWVAFFKANIDSWFGEKHGLVVIDNEYWLLSFVGIIDGVKNWDISRIDVEDLESARKLVKLLSIVEEIGSSMSWKE